MTNTDTTAHTPLYWLDDGSSSDECLFGTRAEAEEALASLRETSPGQWDDMDIEEIDLTRKGNSFAERFTQNADPIIARVARAAVAL